MSDPAKPDPTMATSASMRMPGVEEDSGARGQGLGSGGRNFEAARDIGRCRRAKQAFTRQCLHRAVAALCGNERDDGRPAGRCELDGTSEPLVLLVERDERRMNQQKDADRDTTRS